MSMSRSLWALSALLIPTADALAQSQTGIASYYWQGQRTANGERFNTMAHTCAHRTLPFGTMLRVTNLRNGASTTCRVNDRGPFIRGRIVDLSTAGARQIGMVASGIVPVRIEVVGRR